MQRCHLSHRAPRATCCQPCGFWSPVLSAWKTLPAKDGVCTFISQRRLLRCHVTREQLSVTSLGSIGDLTGVERSPHRPALRFPVALIPPDVELGGGCLFPPLACTRQRRFALELCSF